MTNTENNIQHISIDLIDDPRQAMRSDVNDEGIDELASSIKKHGLISPVVVQSVNGRFEVIAGHRRVTACRRAGIAKVSAIVRDVDEGEALVLKMHENLLRHDVNPVDEAVFIAQTVKKSNLSVSQVAEMTNRSESYIRDRLDILTYPDYLIDAIGEKKIGLAAAGWLARITDEHVRRNYVSFAARGGITTKRAIAWHDSWKAGQSYSNPAALDDVVLPETESPKKHTESCLICGADDTPHNMVLYFIHYNCAQKVTS